VSFYNVYQQNSPIARFTGREILDEETGKLVKEKDWEPNLVFVGEIFVPPGQDAFAAARLLPAFQRVSRQSLRAFPVLEPQPQE